MYCAEYMYVLHCISFVLVQLSGWVESAAEEWSPTN